MKHVLDFLLSIWTWLKGLLWRETPFATQIVHDNLPKQLKPKTLYIVEDDGYQEQAAMICPCGCGRTLHMNLLPDERPCWKVTRHEDGTATLHPSVWRQVECKSHFWFRRGKVEWALSDTLSESAG